MLALLNLATVPPYPGAFRHKHDYKCVNDDVVAQATKRRNSKAQRISVSPKWTIPLAAVSGLSAAQITSTHQTGLKLIVCARRPQNALATAGKPYRCKPTRRNYAPLYRLLCVGGQWPNAPSKQHLSIVQTHRAPVHALPAHPGDTRCYCYRAPRFIASPNRHRIIRKSPWDSGNGTIPFWPGYRPPQQAVSCASTRKDPALHQDDLRAADHQRNSRAGGGILASPALATTARGEPGKTLLPIP